MLHYRTWLCCRVFCTSSLANPFNSNLLFSFAFRQLTLVAKETAFISFSHQKHTPVTFFSASHPRCFISPPPEFLGIAPTYLSSSRQASKPQHRFPESLCGQTESHPGRDKRPKSSPVCNRKGIMIMGVTRGRGLAVK